MGGSLWSLIGEEGNLTSWFLFVSCSVHFKWHGVWSQHLTSLLPHRGLSKCAFHKDPFNRFEPRFNALDSTRLHVNMKGVKLCMCVCVCCVCVCVCVCVCWVAHTLHNVITFATSPSFTFQECVIEEGSQVRLRIMGIRLDATEIVSPTLSHNMCRPQICQEVQLAIIFKACEASRSAR